ncbi:MAG: hypothetical protein V5A23_04930 [Halobacteriales archaeon]
MNELQQLREEGYPVRAVETGDGVEYVAELGPAAGDAAVDVVDGTVIVVIGDEQYEMPVPGADPEAFIRNGVLTIGREEQA